MQGEEDESDLTIWAKTHAEFWDENLITGLDGLMDKESFFSKSFRYNLTLESPSLSPSPSLSNQELKTVYRTEGIKLVANKASYSGRELTTASAVPGRLVGHHKEYAKLTGKLYVLHTVEHGYSKCAIHTLVL